MERGRKIWNKKQTKLNEWCFFSILYSICQKNGFIFFPQMSFRILYPGALVGIHNVRKGVLFANSGIFSAQRQISVRIRAAFYGNFFDFLFQNLVPIDQIFVHHVVLRRFWSQNDRKISGLEKIHRIKSRIRTIETGSWALIRIRIKKRIDRISHRQILTFDYESNRTNGGRQQMNWNANQRKFGN